MWRTILGLSAVLLPFIGAPMGVRAEELLSIPQSATSTVVTPTAPARRLSTREEAAQIRAIHMRLAAERTGVASSGQQSGPPPVLPATPVAPQEHMAPAPVVITPPQQEQVAPNSIRTNLIPPSGSLPLQQVGEKWNPLRLYLEFRSRPRDTAFDVKAEFVTPKGFMSGLQYVTQSGSFTGENLEEVWKGQYTGTRFDLWAGIHGISKDTKTRWSLVGFGRVITDTDSGEGKSRPSNPDSYTYKWRNQPKPLTQLGVRARVERDLIQNKYQQFTVFIEGEAAATVSGQGDWAYNVKTGLWSRTKRSEAYAEFGFNNTGFYVNGFTRRYFNDGRIRLFGELRGDLGKGYSNLQVGGGIQAALGQNGYAEAVLGYNTGTSGDGLAAMLRLGSRF